MATDGKSRGDMSGPVWQRALNAGRKYITPEDVNSACDAGEPEEAVWRDVLIAVDIKSAEDASACAFVALRRFNKL